MPAGIERETEKTGGADRRLAECADRECTPAVRRERGASMKEGKDMGESERQQMPLEVGSFVIT